MRTKPGQASSNNRSIPDGKARRIVTVGANGKPRVKSIVPKPTPLPPKPPSRPVATPHPRPALASYRSTTVEGMRNCHACANLDHVRQYEARQLGKVFLCADCGEKAREETFGRREPLDFAFLGGGFEANRRRH